MSRGLKPSLDHCDDVLALHTGVHGQSTGKQVEAAALVLSYSCHQSHSSGLRIRGVVAPPLLTDDAAVVWMTADERAGYWRHAAGADAVVNLRLLVVHASLHRRSSPAARAYVSNDRYAEKHGGAVIPTKGLTTVRPEIRVVSIHSLIAT